MMIFAALLVLIALQAVAAYIQVRRYKQAVRNMRKLGNVGIGSKKSRFTAGNIVVIACGHDGVIKGGEILQGYTLFNGFKELPGIIGRSIYEVKAEYAALPLKQQKIYSGHLQALEALAGRLESV